ncbi:hypothetical protein KW505_18150 [Vibrio fluvialis]|nr:hypothetical protein [Vibrio fluvialis]MBY8181609.1 hypothetical protein [Vibrio fluvialis]
MTDIEDLTIEVSTSNESEREVAVFQKRGVEGLGSSVNQLLSNLLIAGAHLEIDPDQYLYLAAIHAWDRDADDTMNLVQYNFDEETVRGIVRYVDRYAGREEGYTDSRVSNFLKWGVEQRLMTLAGTSLHNEEPQYRLTQLAHDLLKPYFNDDDFDQQESLSQRYKRIEVLLGELNAIKAEEPNEWFELVRSYLPTLKDLLEGVSKNQELLIAQYGSERQDITKQISSSVVKDMAALLLFAEELIRQINDLKSLILVGADQVLLQLAELQHKAMVNSAPSRLQSGLEDIEVFLERTSEFANMSLIDLVNFLDRLMQTIRLRLTLDPNANLSYLIDRAIELTGEVSWGLALPHQERYMPMREWAPPPPPVDDSLPILEAEGSHVTRQNPTHLMQQLANQIVERELNSKPRVELSDLLGRILQPQDNGFNVTDRHRLAVLTLKTITAKAPMPGDQVQPGWVPIDDEGNLYIENIWVQGRALPENENNE